MITLNIPNVNNEGNPIIRIGMSMDAYDTGFCYLVGFDKFGHGTLLGLEIYTRRAAEKAIAEYLEAHPEYRTPDGLSYRPFAQEGIEFKRRYCLRCQAVGNCEIMTRGDEYTPHDKEFPTEWQYVNGKGVCTAFRQQNELFS